MRLKKLFIYIILTAVFFIHPCYGTISNNNSQINKGLFHNFSYQELVELSKTNQPEGLLKTKLDYILNNPIVDNTISNNDINLQDSPQIGKFIRIASWNISRGLNLDAIKSLLTGQKNFVTVDKLKNPTEYSKISEQAEALKSANIFVLNEVDVGMPRTGYRNVVEELAKAMKYNYVYGVEFIEVDPAHLGLEDYKWSEERFLFPKQEKFQIDQNRYKGLHGNAILSQFPLKNCRIVRLPQVYNWFDGEKKRISQLEVVRRHAAEGIFREDMIREIRQGGRIAVIADVEIPGYSDPVTVVAVHLENRALPKYRKKQLVKLLEQLYNIKNPIILAGDFNSTGYDGSPTTITREIERKLKDPEFLTKTALSVVIPPVGMVNSALTVTNFMRKQYDPTVKNIPIIAPNAERGMYTKIKKAKFADSHKFDLRGTRNKTSNKRSGRLGDSNERGLKGFVPTFVFERPLYVGKYKLDWIFVKPYIKKPKDNKQPYKMAPHFGRTMYDLNYGFLTPFSDHAPITVDLPLEEPSKYVKDKDK